MNIHRTGHSIGRVVKYEVRWKGYDETDDTWVPIENVKQVMEMVKSFHRTKPNAPRDPTVECGVIKVFIMSTQSCVPGGRL